MCFAILCELQFYTAVLKAKDDLRSFIPADGTGDPVWFSLESSMADILDDFSDEPESLLSLHGRSDFIHGL